MLKSPVNSIENSAIEQVNIAAEFKEEYHASTGIAQDSIGNVMDEHVDIAGPGVVGLLVEAFEEV